MAEGLKHIHYLFIIIFLLSYLVKGFLFFFSDTKTFTTYKKKTIIFESIAALGFIVTGIIMIVQHQQATDGLWLKSSGWLHLKLTLVLLSIPLGIVGFKKGNKVLVGLSMAFFIYVFLLALPATRSMVAFF